MHIQAEYTNDIIRHKMKYHLFPKIWVDILKLKSL